MFQIYKVINLSMTHILIEIFFVIISSSMKGDSGIDNSIPGPKGEIGNPGLQVYLFSCKEQYFLWASIP